MSVSVCVIYIYIIILIIVGRGPSYNWDDIKLNYATENQCPIHVGEWCQCIDGNDKCEVNLYTIFSDAFCDFKEKTSENLNCEKKYGR